MHTALDPLESATDFWRRVGNLAEIWCTRHGVLAADDIARLRLEMLVRYAREHSPFYGAVYAHLSPSPTLPQGGGGAFSAQGGGRAVSAQGGGSALLAQLPPVTKSQLMEGFDGWCTDRRVRRHDVERFLADRGRIGEKFMDKYHVWKSSGTSGTPGIFLQDAAAMAVYDALVACQFDGGALGAAGIARLVAAGGRAALVVATGDHFASITSWEHLHRAVPADATRSFSVLDPIDKLVGELNEFMPAFLASYPSVLALLAAERTAGRLRIEPALLWSGGETLGKSTREAIEGAFACHVMNEYGASECLSIAYECPEGWMHVNSEWVILEGVDADGKPSEPGELSDTVLVTNLANWVQPIIRYDLGDRMVALPVPCRCGSPGPAMRIEGRKDAVLALKTRAGRIVRIPPLALSTVVEEAAGERRFQIAQTAADHLAVRFDAPGGATQRSATWRLARTALRGYLDAQSLRNVRVSLDPAPPRLDPRSGKLHCVIVEKHAG